MQKEVFNGTKNHRAWISYWSSRARIPKRLWKRNSWFFVKHKQIDSEDTPLTQKTCPMKQGSSADLQKVLWATVWKYRYFPVPKMQTHRVVVGDPQSVSYLNRDVIFHLSSMPNLFLSATDAKSELWGFSPRSSYSYPFFLSSWARIDILQYTVNCRVSDITVVTPDLCNLNSPV